jgi:hypothetical protein
MLARKQLFRAHAFELACAQNDVAHRLTKPRHPWTNGQVERMNRTIKEATVQRFYYATHDQLRTHLADCVAAYNFARRLKTLKGLTPYECILAMGQFGGAWAGRVIQGPALSGAPWMSGIEQLAEMITTDLEQRLPGQRKTQRDKLALLVATMLQVRSANLMDVAACLPRPAERLDSRYQWIKRFLANTHVVSDAVMAPYGREVLARLAAQGQTVVLLIDQTQVNERHQAVMVAVRLGGRALPLIWRVKETQGAIGFAEQRTALEAVARLLPTGIRPVLIGDRFYGSPNLIGWCCEQGWDWRLRLKQNLLVFEQGGETTLAACFDRGEHQLRDIELTETRVRTNVAMVHEAGHPEPWIIALSQAPSVHTAFDYGLRWGIEAMFSDFKTRGFGLEDSQIRLAGRLDRLILIMALALFWAVSTGLWDAVHRPTPAEKTLPWPTQALCPIPHFLVQAGPAAHSHLPSPPDRHPTPLG